MSTRTYKTLPTSIPTAFEIDRRFAQRYRQMSVERLAELRKTSPGNLYKRMEDGTMHVADLAAWFHDTGGRAVISFLAAQAGGVFIAMPTGRKVGPQDIQALQEALTQAVGALLEFHAGRLDADHCISSLWDGMASLAWHRANVEKVGQPELDLGGADDGR
jgi:hypothetical protein